MKKSIYLFVLLSVFSVGSFAQKITLGASITHYGGQDKGQMQAGKPQGKGSTVFKNGDIFEGNMSKVSVRDRVFIPFLMARNMKASGFKTSSMAGVSTIL